MAWHRPGDKPLSELMVVNLLSHVCVTQPQWVNILIRCQEMLWSSIKFAFNKRCMKIVFANGYWNRQIDNILSISFLNTFLWLITRKKNAPRSNPKDYIDESTLGQIIAWCLWKQDIIWPKVDLEFQCHIYTSLGHNELMAPSQQGQLHNTPEAVFRLLIVKSLAFRPHKDSVSW